MRKPLWKVWSCFWKTCGKRSENTCRVCGKKREETFVELWSCLRKTLWKASLCHAKPWDLTYSALFSASFSANTTCVSTTVSTNPPESPQSLSANTTRVATHVSALLCCSLSGPKDVESPLARRFIKPQPCGKTLLGCPVSSPQLFLSQANSCNWL